MREIIKVVYSGVEITYHENTNTWKFELRGRERSAESLAKAKEAIAKPEPKEKKPFDRISGWMQDRYGNGGWQKVLVTSIAETSYGSPRVWVTKGNGGRSQENPESIALDTPENMEKIEHWKALDEKIEKLNSEQQAIWKGMKKVEVPK